jgi:hypothetical protein
VDLVGGVAAVATGRPDGGNPAPPGPVGDGALGYLKHPGDVGGAQQIALDGRRNLLAVEVGQQPPSLIFVGFYVVGHFALFIVKA